MDPRYLRLLLPCVALGGLLLGSAPAAFAQGSEREGIVRITDKPITTSGKVTPTGFHHHHGHVVTDCPPTSTTYSTCPHGAACQADCYECRCTRHVHAFLDWFNPHGMCTHSPDHGWAPPGKIRSYRRPVAYTKFWPNQWTGQPNPASGGQVAPVVYMPTDTTQLGYYYQQVPRWLPYRGMIPPTPHPEQWHVPLCENGACRHGQAGGCPACQSGVHGYHVTTDSEPTPAGEQSAELERSASNPNLQPITQ